MTGTRKTSGNARLPKRRVVPAEAPLAGEAGELANLRMIAMKLAADLESMLAAPADPVRDAAARAAAPYLDRLLGKNDGVIDGFSTLVNLVIRLTDKERETRAPSQTSLDFDEIDEQELEDRIMAELDVIASRRDAAGDSA